MNLKSFQTPSTRTMISTLASVATSVMLLRSLTREYLPHSFQYYIYFKVRNFFTALSSQFTLVIEEFDGLSYNHLFKAAELYLRPHISPNTKRFRVSMPKKEEKISVTMERNEEIIENFEGVQFKWKLVCNKIPKRYIPRPGSSDWYDSTSTSEIRYFELNFNKKHKEMALAKYLPYVMEQAKEVKEEGKTLKLFTLKDDRIHGRRGDMWQSVNLDHPATFDKLGMDLEMKQGIMEDLERFVERKEFYRKVGKAWKRGYLLFGPPGTGKSSLIAAMANYLNFDIYDLELTNVRSNSQLRKLLISTANRSILVVEDIDCSLDLQNRLNKPKSPGPYPGLIEHRRPKVTLSGFLNFIDGLWSSCGSERIIVFTTNDKDRLDPALLRPGRMDVHLHMSYCTPCAFKMLASIYLSITEHPLFVEIDKLIETTNVTPAEVGEELLKNEEPESALRGVIQLLTEKKSGKGKSEVKQPVDLCTV